MLKRRRRRTHNLPILSVMSSDISTVTRLLTGVNTVFLQLTLVVTCVGLNTVVAEDSCRNVCK